MATVIGVRFKNAGKLYYFDPGTLWPTAGDCVIVETARGLEYGEVVLGVREVKDSELIPPLKPVIRIADARDAEHVKENEIKEREAFDLCQQRILEHRLEMKLVGVEYTFDNAKILFYFTANGRVDFRALVKDLASLFKTRIELRQIGVRDEAKMMGGLGACGRAICCASFLGDFQPVSIKMAKEQNLSLNPTKISGVCGRLMCCLKYEQDTYEAVRKSLPRVGREVLTPDGAGMVVDVNVLKETVRVRVSRGDSGDLKDYPAAEVTRLVGGKPVAGPGETEAAQAAPPIENEPPKPVEPVPSAEPVKPAEPEKPAEPAKPRQDAQPPRKRKPAPQPAHSWPTPEAVAAKLAEAARLITPEEDTAPAREPEEDDTI